MALVPYGVCLTRLPPDTLALSRHAPVIVTSRERELQALRFRAEGCTFDEIGRRLGITKQSAWEAIARAMARNAEAIREQADEVRVMEAERLDAAAAAIWPKVMDGDLRAQDTWLRNRSRYATLLGLDVRDAGTPLVSGPVSINVVPPWEAQSSVSVIEDDDAPSPLGAEPRADSPLL